AASRCRSRSRTRSALIAVCCPAVSLPLPFPPFFTANNPIQPLAIDCASTSAGSLPDSRSLSSERIAYRAPVSPRIAFPLSLRNLTKSIHCSAGTHPGTSNTFSPLRPRGGPFLPEDVSSFSVVVFPSSVFQLRGTCPCSSVSEYSVSGVVSGIVTAILPSGGVILPHRAAILPFRCGNFFLLGGVYDSRNFAQISG